MNEAANPSGNIKENVHGLVDQGHQTVDAIKSRVSGVGAQVKDTSSTILREINTYTMANPVKAVGFALGLGYVAARLRTSPLLELAFLGVFGYGVDRILRRR